METRKILVMIVAAVVCLSVNALGLTFWESEWNDPNHTMPPIGGDAPDPNNFARAYSVSGNLTPFTVISSNCVMTAEHWPYNFINQTLIIGTDYDNNDYKIIQEWNHPDADLSVYKVEKVSDPCSAPFSKWIELYNKDDELGKETLICTYGPLRIRDDDTDEITDIAPTTYEHHWGRNVISSTTGSFSGDHLYISFSEVGQGDYIEYEAYGQTGDSGSGWLIEDANEWKIASLFSQPEIGPRVSSDLDWIYDCIESAGGPSRDPMSVQNLNSRYFYESIQDAIDEASNGDVIEVGPRTYEEIISYGGKALTIRSTDPCDPCTVAATIIDGGAWFYTGEDLSSVLSGFTIRDYDGVVYGAIYCRDTSPTIKNCVFTANNNAIFSDKNTIGSSPLITNCKFYDNTETILSKNGSAIIRNCLIYENDYGIRIQGTDSSEIINCTIADNTDSGIWKVRGASTPTITNCILWDNGDVGDDLHNDFRIYLTYSCITDPCDASGTGNITSDPCFVNADANDFHLGLESPCINAGDPCYTPDTGETDIDGDEWGGRVDMGADEVTRVHNITKDIWYWYINEAIYDANNSDEIVAYEDTYLENVIFDLAVTVSSSDPCDPCVVAATIIDASGSGYPVRFNSGSSNAVLSGFTVTDAATYGIYISSNSPVISNCVIEENDSSGIYSYRSASPTISGNIIRDNGSYGIYAPLSTTSGVAQAKIENNEIYDNSGYGIYISVSSSGTGKTYPKIENNKIYGNTISGIYGNNHSYSTSRLKPTIKNCWIYDNGSYGIRIDKGQGTVYNSTVYGHTTKGIYRYNIGSMAVKNSIIWNNNDDLSGCGTTYSCIQDGDGGTGNIATDPNFVDAASDDYRLTHGSGCIDSADGDSAPSTDMIGQSRIDDPDTLNTGAGDPNYVDMGAYEYNPS
ncbi:MAG: right-handed parallel beta-helix repeat-containing protein [Planctomycetota bacterium]|jgi:parallel beta-helix repeat protein